MLLPSSSLLLLTSFDCLWSSAQLYTDIDLSPEAKKLLSENKLLSEWHAAMEQWLDTESTYRLRIKQAKEASDGAKESQSNYDYGLKKHDLERTEMDDECELIKSIMRYIGVLHDIKATDKSIAAGGSDSVKDPAALKEKVRARVRLRPSHQLSVYHSMQP